SIYLQNILGYSATQAGATFLPMTIFIVILAPIAGKLSDRIGSRWLMGFGMTLVAVSLLIDSTFDQHSSFWNILPALIPGGTRTKCARSRQPHDRRSPSARSRGGNPVSPTDPLLRRCGGTPRFPRRPPPRS